jgi:hypothetical protein
MRRRILSLSASARLESKATLLVTATLSTQHMHFQQRSFLFSSIFKGPKNNDWDGQRDLEDRDGFFSFFCSIAKALYGVDGMRSYLDFCSFFDSFFLFAAFFF